MSGFGRSNRWARMVRSLLVAACCSAAGTAASAVDPAPSPWRTLAATQAAAALEEFRTLETAEPGRAAEARIGQSMALLLVQPRTSANLATARLLALGVAEAGDPAWAPSATYLLARIAEFHTSPPDYAEARRRYRTLIEAHGATELGQVAVAKLAILDLREPVSADERERRYLELEALEPRLTHPAARRDFHLTLADACLREGLGEERALAHSLAAEAAGVLHPARRASVVLRIAELSRRLGRLAEARRHYLRFLDLVGDRDNRVLLVRERLAALPPDSSP